MSNAHSKPVTSLPHRLEPWGMSGWTVRDFRDATEAAEFFQDYPQAAMPRWRRMDVVGGQLVLAR
jgi:hypothetical protein